MRATLALISICAIVVCNTHVHAALNWRTGTCSSASEVYSTMQQKCINNPCTPSVSVFDPASELCACPADKIPFPTGALLPASGAPTCVSCAAISHMDASLASTSATSSTSSGGGGGATSSDALLSHATPDSDFPPTCLPCGENALDSPPTSAFRNLFLRRAAQIVAVNGSAWVYGGGDITAVDGSVSEERVSILAAQWSTSRNLCQCPPGFLLAHSIAPGVDLKVWICTRCTNETNSTAAGPAAGDTYFSCSICRGGSRYDALTGKCACSNTGDVFVERRNKDGGDYCAPLSSILASGTSAAAIGSNEVAPQNKYNSGTKGTPSLSSLLASRSQAAALACKTGKNATACNTLGNLCVLTLYDMASAPCSLYLRLFKAIGCIGVDSCQVPSTLPWLWYLQSSSAIFTATTIKMKISLQPRDVYVHRLRFVIFEYDVAGSLLARRQLTDDLSLCDISTATANEFWLVGRKNLVSCHLNLRYFVQQEMLRKAATSTEAGAGTANNIPSRVYELFLEDSDGGLVPVPVITDATATGDQVPDSTDSSVVFRAASTTQEPVANAWRRRFFLVDTMLSRKTAADTAVPEFVTYARRVSVMVHFKVNADIFVPIVSIQYASALTSDLLPKSDFSSGELRSLQTNNTVGGDFVDSPSFQYRVLFLRGDETIVAAMEPTTIVIGVLVFFSAFGKTYGWMRRQQDTMLGPNAFIRFLIFLCNHFANIFALVIFLTCGSMYVFYKHQAAVEWLLPTRTPYVMELLYTAIACKCAAILYFIFEQCNADYFVIDWERPRHNPANDVPTSNNIASAADGGENPQSASSEHERLMKQIGLMSPENQQKQLQQLQQMQQSRHQFAGASQISMWRSTFVANELNELQVRRSFHVLLVILIVTVFMEGLNYKELARAVPNDNLTPAGSPHSITEPILRIAVCSFFWCMVSLVIYVCEFQIYYKAVAAHPLQAFADLCSVSNISIMILIEPMWGFYIHGESLHAFADCSMEEFQANLQREEQGNMPRRGLGGVQECQTFEVFVGSYLRQFLYVAYSNLADEHHKALRGHAGPVNAGHHRRCFETVCGGAGQTRVFTPHTMSIKRQINSLMQQSVRNAEKNLMNKIGVHALMDFPPNIMYLNGPFAQEKAGSDLFFLDSPTAYEQAFLSGIDFDLFVFYALVYAAMDATIQNTFWCMLTIYLIDAVLLWYRAKEGTANLGAKTLFDDRFFL